MKKLYENSSVPSAIITKKRNELKYYRVNETNTIYLNDNDLFEIRFFNPLNVTVGAEIFINNKKISDSKIVLYPGQDVTIERYLDTNRKFKFETYTVDTNNPAVKNAIKNNGIIEIYFYKEKEKSVLNNLYVSNDTYTYYDNSSISYTASLNNFNSTFDDSFKGKSRSRGLEETGRIGKGGYSDQQFENVDIDFEFFSFHNVIYKLMPMSQKKEQTSVVYPQNIRNYCSTCGYRIRKSSWVYCPKCGDKLQ